MTRQADCKRRVGPDGQDGRVVRGGPQQLIAGYRGMVLGDSRLDWMPGALNATRSDGLPSLLVSR